MDSLLDFDKAYDENNGFSELTDFATELGVEDFNETAAQNMASRGEINRGVRSGTRRTMGLLAGAGGAIADAVGADDTAQSLYDTYRKQENLAQLNSGSTENFTDIDSVGSAVDWLAYNVGSQVPNMLSVAASGGLTGVLGKKVLGKVVERAIEKQVAAGVERVIAEKFVADRLKQAAVKTGVAVGSSALETGGMWAEDVKKHGVEGSSPVQDIAMGTLSGSTEVISPTGRLSSALGGARRTVENTGKSLLYRMGLSVPKNMGQEGAQEVTQQFIGKVNEKLNDPSVSLFDKQALKQYLNSWAGGAAIGGLSGPVETLTERQKNKVAPSQNILKAESVEDAIDSFEQELTPNIDKASNILAQIQNADIETLDSLSTLAEDADVSDYADAIRQDIADRRELLAQTEVANGQEGQGDTGLSGQQSLQSESLGDPAGLSGIDAQSQTGAGLPGSADGNTSETKQPWEMTREEYDLWRVDQLNERNPQLANTLVGSIVDVVPGAASDDSSGVMPLLGGHNGSTISRTKKAPAGTFSHEIRHAIDMLLGGRQVTAWIGDIVKRGGIEQFKSALRNLREKGVWTSGRLTDNEEISQVALEIYYQDRAALAEIDPDLVDFLDKMGAGKYADLVTPHKDQVRAAIESGQEVSPEVLNEYPDLAEEYSKRIRNRTQEGEVNGQETVESGATGAQQQTGNIYPQDVIGSDRGEGVRGILRGDIEGGGTNGQGKQPGADVTSQDKGNERSGGDAQEDRYARQGYVKSRGAEANRDQGEINGQVQGTEPALPTERLAGSDATVSGDRADSPQEPSGVQSAPERVPAETVAQPNVTPSNASEVGSGKNRIKESFSELYSQSSKLQEKEDDIYDELSKQGKTYEEIQNDSNYSSIQRERVNTDKKAAVKAYDGAKDIIEKELNGVAEESLYGSVKSILSHYWLDESGIFGAYNLSHHTGQQINNPESRKKVTKMIASMLLAKSNPIADFFLTMESSASGLTDKGKRNLLVRAEQIAARIDEKLAVFFTDSNNGQKIPEPKQIAAAASDPKRTVENGGGVMPSATQPKMQGESLAGYKVRTGQKLTLKQFRELPVDTQQQNATPNVDSSPVRAEQGRTVNQGSKGEVERSASPVLSELKEKRATELTREEYRLRDKAEGVGPKNKDVSRQRHDISILSELFDEEIKADSFAKGINRTIQSLRSGNLRNSTKVKIVDQATFNSVDNGINALYARAVSEGKPVPQSVLADSPALAERSAKSEKQPQKSANATGQARQEVQNAKVDEENKVSTPALNEENKTKAPTDGKTNSKSDLPRAGKPTISELKDVGLLNDFGGRWKYKFSIDNSSWFTANTKEDAVERATSAYLKAKPSERLTRKQRDDLADKTWIEDMDRHYGTMTDNQIEEKIERLGGSISGNKKTAAREFNNNGGRRTSASVSAEAYRVEAEERNNLKRYLKLKKADLQSAETVAESSRGVSSQSVQLPKRFDYGDGRSVSEAARELRDMAYPKKKQESDVFMGSHDNYVPLDEAVSRAKEALAAGIKPYPLQISYALDIAPGEGVRVLAAAQEETVQPQTSTQGETDGEEKGQRKEGLLKGEASKGASGKPKKSQSQTPSNLANIEEELTQHLGKFGLTRLLRSGAVKILDTQEEAMRIAEGGKLSAAYHGSPHDFDKFRSSAIGTGEGAQAYGYGLYFASRKDVAEWYRDVFDTRDSSWVGSGLLEYDRDFVARALVLGLSPQQFKKAAKLLYEPLVEYKNAYSTFISFDKNNIPKRTSKLYEVELAPSENEYLMWDNPLSEQSELVKDIYTKAFSNPPPGVDSFEWMMGLSKSSNFGPRDPVGNFGNAFYRAVSAHLGDQAASDYLHSLGIRGIKYLDGSSRSKGEGAFNYVIFSEEDVTIKAKYAKDGKTIQGLFVNGQSYLVRDGISKGDTLGVLLHEYAEHAVHLGFTKDAEYQGILSSLERRQNMKGAVGDAIRAAMARVPEDTAPEHFWSETAAYLVESHANTNISLFNRITAFFKKWLYKAGKISADRLNHKDIVVFAKAAVKAAAGGDVAQRAMLSVKNMFKPVDVESENFKKWFDGSKVVDDNGKPLRVYHGTSAEFNEFDNNYSEDTGIHFGTQKAANRRIESNIDEFRDNIDGYRIVPVYLAIKNPLRVDDYGGDRESWETAIGDAKDNGYDGLVYRNEFEGDGTEDSYVAFSPTQIKSAISNTGAFSSTDPRIQYSKKDERNPPPAGSEQDTPSWEISSDPKQERKDTILYNLQDKFIDLKRIQDAITEQKGDIAEAHDVRIAEELYHKRASARTEDFLLNDVKPLMDELGAIDSDIVGFEEFLWARHAPEANKSLKERNPNKKELAALKEKAKQKRDELQQSETVQLFIKRERELSSAERDVEVGDADDSLVAVISQEIAKLEEEKVVQDYIEARSAHRRLRNAKPFEGDNTWLSGMKTEDAIAYRTGLNPAKRLKYEALAKKWDKIISKTRQTLVDYGLESQETVDSWADSFKYYVPLHREDMGVDDNGNARGIGQGFSVKGSSTKSRTGSTRKVVDVLAHVVMQRERAIVRGEKGIISKALLGLAISNPNKDFWSVDTPPTIKTVDPVTGLVVSNIDPGYKNRPNVVVARTLTSKGKIKEHAVVFNEQNQRAMRTAEALKNLDTEQLGVILNASAKITRFFSAMNTQYNIVFGPVNAVRDIGSALLHLTDTKLHGKQTQVARLAASNIVKLYKAIRAESSGAPLDNDVANAWKELQREGGTTGFRDMFRNANDRAEALKKGILAFQKNKTLSNVKNFRDSLFGWVSDYNDVMENSTRLAVYMVAKESGLSKRRAASMAKNITLNFNRKGKVAAQAGAMYAFFNASVQGTEKLYRTLKGPFGRKIILGGAMIGVAQAVMLSAAGFGDDEPPEFVKERSLIIPTGGKTYVSIPLPLGFHLLPHISRTITEWAINGGKNTGEKIGSIVSSFAEAFNPIGNAGLSIQSIAPTPIDPLVALSENKDWTGRPIAKENINALKPTPGHTRARDNASAVGMFVSKFLNYMTGGTEHVPGMFSPTPDQVDYLAGQVFGGVGRETVKLSQIGRSVATGEELPIHRIPFVSRFFGSSGDGAGASEQFYRNIKKANELDLELDGIRSSGGDIRQFKMDNPGYQYIKYSERMYQDISKMQKKKRQLVRDGADAESVKMVDTRIKQRMQQYNERVRW